MFAILSEVAATATGETGVGNVTEENIGVMPLEAPVEGLAGNSDYLGWEQRGVTMNGDVMGVPVGKGLRGGHD